MQRSLNYTSGKKMQLHYSSHIHISKIFQNRESVKIEIYPLDLHKLIETEQTEFPVQFTLQAS